MTALTPCSVVRRRKSEQAQQLMLWKIDFEDIDFLLSERAGSHCTRSQVMVSRLCYWQGSISQDLQLAGIVV